LRFRLEQVFDAPVEEVARAYTEPGLYERLGDLPKLGRPELVERQEDGDVIQLQVRYRFTGDLSAAARRVVDPAKLSWVEHTTHDLTRHQVDFRMAPDHYPDRLRSSGRYSFQPDGAGARRLTEGELVVRVPLVGGAVERAIVSGLRDHLSTEVAVVERFLKEQR
jgi:uncharacterized protein DUF2505